VMLLVHDRVAGVFPARVVDTASLPARIGRVALAAVAFTAVWRGTYAALGVTGTLHTPAGALLAGAVPAFVLLPAPLVLEHLIGAARVRILAIWRPEPRLPHRRLHKRRA
jgi:hypothetical protein